MADAAGWRPDPTGRHQERYFKSSGVPTNVVRNDGVESTDEGPSGRGNASTPTSGLANATKPAPISSREITPLGTDQTGSAHTLVASYRAPMVNEASLQTAQAHDGSATSLSPVVVVRGRNWWHIAAAGVLVVLLAAASVIAVQQHTVANKWMTEYHAEVHKNQAEVRKSEALFASLLLSQQRQSTCANDAKSVLSDVLTYFRNGFLPSQSESDATNAAQMCQTSTQSAQF